MAAASIMVVLVTIIMMAMSNVISSWSRSAGQLQCYHEADVVYGIMQYDFESIVVRKNGRAWFQVAYPNDVGELTGTNYKENTALKPPEIMFFSPTNLRPKYEKTDVANRDYGDRNPIPGSVCAIKYQLSYKSPFKDGDSSPLINEKQPNAFYGLYRAVIDSRSTFLEALGTPQGDPENYEFAMSRFWDGTCTVIDEEGNYKRGVSLRSWVLSPENLISTNMVEFRVTFGVLYKRQGQIGYNESAYKMAYIPSGVPFTVGPKILMMGSAYEKGTGGGDVSVPPNEIGEGYLSSLEVSMTYVPDVIANEMRIAKEKGTMTQELFKDMILKHGVSVSRKLKFVAEPSE